MWAKATTRCCSSIKARSSGHIPPVQETNTTMSWMLSNGNVLFTRMQYIAEITPDKKVVWRFDAPSGTEIHACQPIGLDKILFRRVPCVHKSCPCRSAPADVEAY